MQNDKNFPKHSKYLTNKCTGKNVTDAVESLICALYLSTKCVKTCLEWISHIKLVPITFADSIIEKFDYKVDYTMR
jgi:dsRNA-specific ribonuclease